MIPCGSSSGAPNWSMNRLPYSKSGRVMMMDLLGADWKPIAPFQVMFWIEERVPFVRMSISRAPLATKTRFVASITRGRTRCIGSADSSSSSSGPPDIESVHESSPVGMLVLLTVSDEDWPFAFNPFDIEWGMHCHFDICAVKVHRKTRIREL